MATISTKDHEKFCKADGWEKLSKGQGKSVDHKYYRKTLEDGTVLTTKICHGKKKYQSYGPELWKKVWKHELQLDSPDQFFECLKTGQPVMRNAQDVSVQEPTQSIPKQLEILLLYTAGMSQSDIDAMTPQDAQEYWELYCGIDQYPNPEVDYNLQPDIDQVPAEKPSLEPAPAMKLYLWV